ncbi:hypothetical protein CL634_01210 [bacterium]|nr:hypothetical protein [bacterium]
MQFLNPKEQVIDLQLTSYGKYLLSIGRFKPASYAFFDSDIIYDHRFAQSGSVTKTLEAQNNIEGRIQQDTPRLSAQTLYRGSEIGVFSTNPNLAYNLMPGVLADKKNDVNLTQTPDKSYIFAEPIGNSAYNSKNIAAWNINFLKAPLSSSNPWYTGSNNDIPTAFIPQLKCDIRYYIEKYPANIEKQDAHTGWQDMENIKSFDALAKERETIYNVNTPIMFSDDTYMIYKDDFVLLKVEEANTEFLKENFEIEVFKREEVVKKDAKGNLMTGSYSEVLKQLFFEGDNVKDEDRVDYYFDINFDFEIDEEEYCKLQSDLNKIENIYVDKVFNCKDKKETLHSLNIYDTEENQDPEDVC